MAKKHAPAKGQALALAALLLLALAANATEAGAAGSDRQVHGYVWPICDEELIPGFMERHEVTVELRETFRTPAAPGLSAAAEPSGAGGTGEFMIENVPYGDYVLVIERPGYLTRCMEVTVSAQSPGVIELVPPDVGPNGAYDLWWGDCDGNLTVGDGDIRKLQSQWNACANGAGYSPACDFDADGRTDNSDALLLMTHYGLSAWDYPGAEAVDFGAAPGPTGSSVTLGLIQGREYIVPVTAQNIGSFDGRAITVSYDQAALGLLSAAGQLHGDYASAGPVPGTGITVAAVSPGSLTLEFGAEIPQGASWTGAMTIIKFVALANGETDVYIGME